MELPVTNDSCPKCFRKVTARQDALQCDICNHWVHRTCGTSLSHAAYTEITRQIRQGIPYDWACQDCMTGPRQTVTVSGQYATGDSDEGDVTVDDPELSPAASPAATGDSDDDEVTVEHLESTRATGDLGGRQSFEVSALTAQEDSVVTAAAEVVGASAAVVNESSIIVDQQNVSDVSNASGEEEEYVVLAEGTSKCRPLLQDTDGYQYSRRISRGNENVVYWRCVVRNKHHYCRSTVIQRGETFTRGLHDHGHPPKAGHLVARVVAVKTKQQAAANVFSSATTAAEDVIVQHVTSAACSALPKIDSVARAANRHRHKNRPRHPRTLDFDLVTDHVPAEFLTADIQKSGTRHLLFATVDQLQLLSQAKTWYVDGTFKVVREPFVQLFSVHAFVSKDGQLKQLPLAFVVMSRRRRKDYKRVFTALLEALPQQPRVEAVVSDFEAAVWSAISEVLPGVTQRGCAFHFSQAVWRNVQAVGLQSVYCNNEEVNRICRKTMALPFLPAAVITAAFDVMETEATNNPQVTEHLAYVRRTWIESTMWPPAAWSVYKQPVRTNNDVEGWHHRINTKANHSRLNLYQLMRLLHNEALLVRVNVRLLSEGSTARMQRKAYSKLHSRLARYWDEYADGKRSVRRLLSACAHVCKHA